MSFSESKNNAERKNNTVNFGSFEELEDALIKHQRWLISTSKGDVIHFLGHWYLVECRVGYGMTNKPWDCEIGEDMTLVDLASQWTFLSHFDMFGIHTGGGIVEVEWFTKEIKGLSEVGTNEFNLYCIRDYGRFEGGQKRTIHTVVGGDMKGPDIVRYESKVTVSSKVDQVAKMPDSPML